MVEPGPAVHEHERRFVPPPAPRTRSSRCRRAPRVVERCLGPLSTARLGRARLSWRPRPRARARAAGCNEVTRTRWQRRATSRVRMRPHPLGGSVPHGHSRAKTPPSERLPNLAFTRSVRGSTECTCRVALDGFAIPGRYRLEKEGQAVMNEGTGTAKRGRAARRPPARGRTFNRWAFHRNRIRYRLQRLAGAVRTASQAIRRRFPATETNVRGALDAENVLAKQYLGIRLGRTGPVDGRGQRTAPVRCLRRNRARPLDLARHIVFDGVLPADTWPSRQTRIVPCGSFRNAILGLSGRCILKGRASGIGANRIDAECSVCFHAERGRGTYRAHGDSCSRIALLRQRLGRPRGPSLAGHGSVLERSTNHSTRRHS
jgi:hypothetical protein